MCRKNIELLKIYKIIPVIIGLLLCFPANAVEPDKNGNTPESLAKTYYEAINKNDFAKIKNMYSKGYYNSIVTKRGFLETPDEKLFLKYERKRFFKNRKVDIDPARNGFFENGAKNVYSVMGKIFFTDEYLKTFEEMNGIKSDYVNDELCFKLINGEWKITDKIKGF